MKKVILALIIVLTIVITDTLWSWIDYVDKVYYAIGICYATLSLIVVLTYNHKLSKTLVGAETDCIKAQALNISYEQTCQDFELEVKTLGREIDSLKQVEYEHKKLIAIVENEYKFGDKVKGLKNNNVGYICSMRRIYKTNPDTKKKYYEESYQISPAGKWYLRNEIRKVD